MPARWLPSARSVVVGLALLALIAIAFLVARQTSIFAVQTIEVEGAPPEVAGRVRDALAPIVGASLVAFEPGAADRRLAEIPEIASASYDRDFPHTLRVLVRAERPIAILRQGSQGWLVSSSARVLRQLHRPFPELPRIWIPRNVAAPVGSTLAGLSVSAVRAVAPLGGSSFLAAVRSVRAEEGELTLVLGSGLEVRVGDTRDLALKLAVARRLLPRSEGAVYVDVSVPERSVVGYSLATTDSQVEG